MLQIPLSAVPSQTLSIVLDGQNCQLAIYQKQPITDQYGVAAGLFFDLIVNGTPIINTARCLDRTPILQDKLYLSVPEGLTGQPMFLDTLATQGGPPTFNGQPPYYTGLGAQFVLLYLTGADLASVGFVDDEHV
jgi:hypothetical protein